MGFRPRMRDLVPVAAVLVPRAEAGEACAPGLTGWVTGAGGECEPCPGGTFWSLEQDQDGNEAGACNECEAGTYSAPASWASQLCVPCPIGTYGEAPPGEICTVCPSGAATRRIKSATGDDCVCQIGFRNADREVVTGPSLECVACDSGEACFTAPGQPFWSLEGYCRSDETRVKGEPELCAAVATEEWVRRGICGAAGACPSATARAQGLFECAHPYAGVRCQAVSRAQAACEAVSLSRASACMRACIDGYGPAAFRALHASCTHCGWLLSGAALFYVSLCVFCAYSVHLAMRAADPGSLQRRRLTLMRVILFHFHALAPLRLTAVLWDGAAVAPVMTFLTAGIPLLSFAACAKRWSAWASPVARGATALLPVFPFTLLPLAAVCTGVAVVTRPTPAEVEGMRRGITRKITRSPPRLSEVEGEKKPAWPWRQHLAILLSLWGLMHALVLPYTAVALFSAVPCVAVDATGLSHLYVAQDQLCDSEEGAAVRRAARTALGFWLYAATAAYGFVAWLFHERLRASIGFNVLFEGYRRDVRCWRIFTLALLVVLASIVGFSRAWAPPAETFEDIVVGSRADYVSPHESNRGSLESLMACSGILAAATLLHDSFAPEPSTQNGSPQLLSRVSFFVLTGTYFAATVIRATTSGVEHNIILETNADVISTTVIEQGVCTGLTAAAAVLNFAFICFAVHAFFFGLGRTFVREVVGRTARFFNQAIIARIRKRRGSEGQAAPATDAADDVVDDGSDDEVFAKEVHAMRVVADAGFPPSEDLKSLLDMADESDDDGEGAADEILRAFPRAAELRTLRKPLRNVISCAVYRSVADAIQQEKHHGISSAALLRLAMYEWEAAPANETEAVSFLEELGFPDPFFIASSYFPLRDQILQLVCRFSRDALELLNFKLRSVRLLRYPELEDSSLQALPPGEIDDFRIRSRASLEEKKEQEATAANATRFSRAVAFLMRVFTFPSRFLRALLRGAPATINLLLFTWVLPTAKSEGDSSEMPTLKHETRALAQAAATRLLEAVVLDLRESLYGIPGGFEIELYLASGVALGTRNDGRSDALIRKYEKRFAAERGTEHVSQQGRNRQLILQAVKRRAAAARDSGRPRSPAREGRLAEFGAPPTTEEMAKREAYIEGLKRVRDFLKIFPSAGREFYRRPGGPVLTVDPPQRIINAAFDNAIIAAGLRPPGLGKNTQEQLLYEKIEHAVQKLLDWFSGSSAPAAAAADESGDGEAAVDPPLCTVAVSANSLAVDPAEFFSVFIEGAVFIAVGPELAAGAPAGVHSAIFIGGLPTPEIVERRQLRQLVQRRGGVRRTYRAAPRKHRNADPRGAAARGGAGADSDSGSADGLAPGFPGSPPIPRLRTYEMELKSLLSFEPVVELVPNAASGLVAELAQGAADFTFRMWVDLQMYAAAANADGKAAPQKSGGGAASAGATGAAGSAGASSRETPLSSAAGAVREGEGSASASAVASAAAGGLVASGGSPVSDAPDSATGDSDLAILVAGNDKSAILALRTAELQFGLLHADGRTFAPFENYSRATALPPSAAADWAFVCVAAQVRAAEATGAPQTTLSLYVNGEYIGFCRYAPFFEELTALGNLTDGRFRRPVVLADFAIFPACFSGKQVRDEYQSQLGLKGRG